MISIQKGTLKYAIMVAKEGGVGNSVSTLLAGATLVELYLMTLHPNPFTNYVGNGLDVVKGPIYYISRLLAHYFNIFAILFRKIALIM